MAGREPWVKILVGLRRSAKISGLPSDSARLGWVYTLLEAKVQRELGVFGSMGHYREVLGRFGRYFRVYMDAGLLEAGPDLCAECASRYVGLKDGQIVVHDFLVEQRPVTAASDDEPTPGAKRTAMWRLRQMIFERDNWTCRYCGRDDYERDWLIAEHVIPDGPTTPENLVTACRGCNKKKGPRTPKQAGMVLRPEPLHPDHETRHGDASRGSGDASRDASDSRARGTTATATTTETSESNQSLGRESQHRATDEQKNGSDGPRLTKAQLDAWRSFGSEWDEVKAAWLARGFRHPPAGDPDDERSQRALLYEILDARPTDLVRWIRDAPAKAPSDQVVGHVLAKWRAVKAEVDADDQVVPWLRERSAMEPVGAVVERVVGR